MKYNFLIENLINTNKELVEKTAIKNCHCIGLNSFIINEKPKIRLFIANDNCELYNEFDIDNPLIPIHPHKYNDTFLYNQGDLIHHRYIKTNHKDSEIFNSYKYKRLNDKFELEKLQEQKLEYIGGYRSTQLEAFDLHTVEIRKLNNKNVSWLIIEGEEDKNFQQIAYHKDLKVNTALYKSFKNPIEYIKNYLEC